MNQTIRCILSMVIFALCAISSVWGAAQNKGMSREQDSATLQEIEMNMVTVQGGCFHMGDNFGNGWENERPVHEVCLNTFRIGKYEVTQGEWQKVMGINPSHFSACGDDCPVEQVTWGEVQEFIRKLNSRTNRKYRLPTEAEWEYAARSGGKREKYSGGDNAHTVAWYSTTSDKRTHPVGQKQPNGLGLFDMSGNVSEWVSDWYGPYANTRQQDPQGPPSGSLHVFRGGGWNLGDSRVRAAIRFKGSLEDRSSFLGFRLAAPMGLPHNSRQQHQTQSVNKK